jgi:hypothetical protein
VQSESVVSCVRLCVYFAVCHNHPFIHGKAAVSVRHDALSACATMRQHVTASSPAETITTRRAAAGVATLGATKTAEFRTLAGWAVRCSLVVGAWWVCVRAGFVIAVHSYPLFILALCIRRTQRPQMPVAHKHSATLHAAVAGHPRLMRA